MTISRSPKIAAATLLIAGALTPWLIPSEPSEPAVSVDAAATTPSRAPLAPALGWQLDVEHTYAFEHELETRVERAAATGVDGEPFTGQHRIEGSLGLTAVEELEDGGWRLLWNVRSLESVSAELMGRDVSRDARAVEGRTASVDIDQEGTVMRLRMPRDTPDYAREVLRSIVVEGTIVVRSGQTLWTRERSGTFGNGPTTSRVTAALDDGVRIESGRTRMSQVHLLSGHVDDAHVVGRTSVRLRGAGYVESLETSDTVVIGDEASPSARGRVHLRLQYLGMRRARQAQLDSLETVALGGEAGSRREALLARAAGLTVEQALEDLQEHADAGRMPDHGAWFYRVTGLLLLHPDACDAFAQAALGGDRTAAAQAVALDVLASVGTTRAQAALRTVLTETSFAESPVFGRLVQSLVAVEAPDAASVAFAEGLYAGEGPGRLAAANVLGSQSAALRRSGDDSGAARLVAELSVGLTDSAVPEEARAHVIALGNSGASEAMEALSGRAGDASPEVRRSVARALRHLPQTADVRPTLDALLADEDARVRGGAVTAMLARGLADGDAARLGHMLGDGSLGVAGSRTLLMAAIEGQLGETNAAPILQAAVRSTELPRGLRARARMALRQQG